jgi:two-component system response regulator (stage 0 sporulation protein F)
MTEMAKKKVLIIDDERGFSQLVVDFFEAHGYQVFAADNLEDALAAFRRERPKVVLLDFNMPKVTGERLLPLLQTADPTVKVIVVSGFIEEEVEEKFKGMGYYSFFKKGDLSFQKLKDKVDEALGVW